MLNCRFCNSENLIKNGFVQGKQRFLCKNCKKNQLILDSRQKYDEKTRYLAVSMRIFGSGLRQIAKTLSLYFNQKIHYQTIDKWIKNDYKKLQIDEKNEQKTSENIDIIEMDELYTFIKKNKIKSEFGLLFLGTKIVLLKSSLHRV